MIRAITKLMAPLHRRIMLMVGRAVLELVDDSRSVQVAQVSLLSDEVRDKVERFQNYGFSSNPHSGAEGIVVCLGGSRDHAIMIACDDRRYRLTGLASGEVALYDDLGQAIILKRSGIELTTTNDVTVNAVNLRVNGNIVATGDISDHAATTAKSMAGMRTTYNSHTHKDNSHGVNTNAPNQAM